MYAESNVTSCICHKLGICTLTNPSVGDVIYFLLVDYITHAWIGQCSYITHAWSTFTNHVVYIYIRIISTYHVL